MRMPGFSGLWWWRKIYSNIIFMLYASSIEKPSAICAVHSECSATLCISPLFDMCAIYSEFTSIKSPFWHRFIYKKAPPWRQGFGFLYLPQAQYKCKAKLAKLILYLFYHSIWKNSSIVWILNISAHPPITYRAHSATYVPLLESILILTYCFRLDRRLPLSNIRLNQLSFVNFAKSYFALTISRLFVIWKITISYKRWRQNWRQIKSPCFKLAKKVHKNKKNRLK